MILSSSLCLLLSLYQLDLTSIVIFLFVLIPLNNSSYPLSAP